MWTRAMHLTPFVKARPNCTCELSILINGTTPFLGSIRFCGVLLLSLTVYYQVAVFVPVIEI